MPITPAASTSAGLRVAAVAEILTLGSGRYRLTLDCGRVIVTGRRYRDEVQQRLANTPCDGAPT